MELPESAKTAEIIWMHYQQALVSGVFKTEYHKKIVSEMELLWRERYINETEEAAVVIMAQAGCQVIDNSNGQYSII